MRETQRVCGVAAVLKGGCAGGPAGALQSAYSARAAPNVLVTVLKALKNLSSCRELINRGYTSRMEGDQYEK